MIKKWGIRFLCVLATLALTLLPLQPILANTVTFYDISGVYTVRTSLAGKYLTGERADSIREGVLTITDNTETTCGVISTCSLALTDGGTVAMVGFVGSGTRPLLSLIGSDGETVISFNGRVGIREGVVTTMSGRASGFAWHSSGTLGDDPVGAAATWSVAQQYDGSTAALLTQAAAAGSTYVQFVPRTTIHLSDLDTITAGWSLAHMLQDTKANGPQVELRFVAPTNVNPDGAGHVDVTLLPYQQAGTGAWVVSQLTSAATRAGYYGNDPYDSTAFDEFSGTILLEDIEAAINAEAAMLANGGFTCGDWELARVRIELWEAGARTCYIDYVVIDDEVYSFEPIQYLGSFSARVE